MDRYPRNAGALIDIRLRGVVPDLPVLVSLVGALPEYTNVVLQAYAGESHDWRPLAGLNVEVFASSAVAFAELLAMLGAIAAVVPETLVLTFIEGPRIHCGEARRITDFKLFDWLPMAIGPACYLEGALIARRIFAELGKSIATPYDEACDLVVQIAQENARCA
jgi:hypothetical protein